MLFERFSIFNFNKKRKFSLADFYNISDWNEKPWYQTGGTRNKIIVENTSNQKDYYFKTSLKREQKDYKYEFWSEIIASEVGTFLGFNLLRYDIAYNKGEIGCISESMVTEGVNKLTEGMNYLTGYDTTYNPEDKNAKKQYTFQFIKETLEYYRLGSFIINIIEIVIFDSIIGNGDRHQENWGIIDEKLKQMKSDNSMMEAYIRHGVAEIHRDGTKLNHFELK